MKTFAAISTLISVFLAAPAFADCREVSFEDTPFTVCEADPATDDIRLFLNDPEGALLGSFNNVSDTLNEGQSLRFAMNDGMYHSDRRPVGLYVEAGKQLAPVVTRDGPGNFGLLPNGVFCLADGAANVTETQSFARANLSCEFASQSGPMLVIEGKLHPRFLPNSDSRFIRNGVGVTTDGALVAAISDKPVNFHRFARLFRDVLDTPNALYIDGKVSRLYAPDLGRHDAGLPMGPILGVVD